ncbi:hypothetical protein CAPTEDRAFT_199445 [Capitella teleta]|uniref:Uncharacterized protein n=1 Tax=Capitella teleta TaxID=283909 RepID=R7V946_CAPTE|nr:hypothetical protein CAPTEDRAFT_199445 [Capitella teleta]|eukprot:ELU15368.1 hypothetical protein CAPTEDRAFT_199445 [Capitella teleta]
MSIRQDLFDTPSEENKKQPRLDCLHGKNCLLHKDHPSCLQSPSDYLIAIFSEANKNPEGTAHALCHTDAAFDLANGTDQFIRDVLCVLIAGTKPRSQFKDKGARPPASPAFPRSNDALRIVFTIHRWSTS